MKRLLIVRPTVDGRDRFVERSVRLYRETTMHLPIDVTTIQIANRSTTGEAWKEGASQASKFDYLHLTADDLEPQPGWLEAAIECADRGCNPVPFVRNSVGDVESCGEWQRVIPDGRRVRMSVIPFMLAEDWQHVSPIVPDVHYFSDDTISAVLDIKLGRPQVVTHAYSFVHTWAQAGRKRIGDAKWYEEEAIYRSIVDQLRRGQL